MVLRAEKIPNNIDGGVVIEIKGKNRNSHFTFRNFWPWL